LAKRDKCGGTEIGRGMSEMGRQTGETGKTSEREKRREDDENMESDGGPRRDRANLELFA